MAAPVFVVISSGSVSALLKSIGSRCPLSPNSLGSTGAFSRNFNAVSNQDEPRCCSASPHRAASCLLQMCTIKWEEGSGEAQRWVEWVIAQGQAGVITVQTQPPEDIAQQRDSPGPQTGPQAWC